jgi:Holliday junction DNA helicase RuvB
MTRETVSQPISILALTAQAQGEFSADFTPQSFDDYLGQTELKHKLAIYTCAAKQRNEALDHLLLFGPPGLGKTTLATVIATELGVNIKICSGPTLERTGDLVAQLTSLQPRDILFIDEIHRMPIAVEEVLYSAMEQCKVDIIIGQGAGAQAVSLPLNPFTLLGATTRAGLLSAPLRSRFGITERLDFYTQQELSQILLQSARFLNLPLSPEAALLIAGASRGTPRIAKKLLRRIRDVAQIENAGIAELSTVAKTLALLGLSDDGLTAIDRTIMTLLAERFNGGPVGLDTLASLIGEDRDTLEDVYEPYLIRMGYLERTPRGRQLSPHAYRALAGQLAGQTRLL